jgi:hypothetical protein
MFFELALQDRFLIMAFVTLLFSVFILIFVFVKKRLPTGRGYLDLGEKGFLITLGIHFVILLFCIGMTIYRSRSIIHFTNNGISITASIQKIIKKNNKELHFSYTYEMEGKMYFGDTKVFRKKEFSFYIIGKKIYILVDPEDYKKSLFVRISRDHQ